MMPHLVRWHDEYADYGLVILTMHQQPVEPEVLRERCQSLGIRFTVCIDGHIRDSKSSGIPNCALFLPSGECVYDGHPKDVETKLRAAIGAMIVADIATPTKAMQPVVDAIRKGSPPMESLKKLVTLKTADKATAEQAKALFDKIALAGKRRLEAIKESTLNDPIAAYHDAARLAILWKGYETGTKATELANKLKADKGVIAELKARPSLDVIKKMDTALLAAAVGVEITDAAFKKKFAPQLKELKKLHDAMKRQYPDARSTKEAAEIVEKYELTK